MPCLCVLVLTACTRPSAAVSSPVAAAPDISVPFRNRWWHFYERGLAWADAGNDAAAEADLRQCLRLRRTDSRLARTYGMHFVQCFAQRELAAVLIRRGQPAEAEHLLRLSLEQEPSAKAEVLLRQITAPLAAPAPPPSAGPPRLELAAVAPVPERLDLLRILGRVSAPAGTVLWRITGPDRHELVSLAADGSFACETAPGSSLGLGGATGPDPAIAPSVRADPVAEGPPVLTLDGPDDGARVGDGVAWYRWTATAGAGLASLQVDDGAGQPLARQDITGAVAGGTLRILLPDGAQTLRFSLCDRAGHAVTAERRVDAQPAPQQDRALRAVALAIPLQAPRPGAMRPGDDPRLLTALLDDGRFRLLDHRADDILAGELALVEAGHVDRATAAAAGRRLASRYVIAGTMTRGAQDAECFLRLIHAETGEVIATADAYAVLAAGSDAEPLFAATAGRLRQAFPILAGPVSVAGDGTLRFSAGGRQGAKAHVRIHLFAGGQPAGRAAPVGSAELDEIALDDAHATPRSGEVPATGWGVGE